MPIVRLHVGPQGLEMAAHQQECVIVYQQPDKHASETLFFPADVLADVEGKDGSVTLETSGDGKGEARWNDTGVPRCRPFQTVKSERMAELPTTPRHWQPIESAFLRGLAEATRTTSRDGVRYAMTRIQLRGRRGQLVATDGRQLLVQGDFSLPWPEDVLIPALPLFVSRDLPTREPMAIGRTDKYVSLRTGPWTFQLEIDSNVRYPNVESVVPRIDRDFSQLRLSEDDACFLTHVLPKLPGDKDHSSPVPLDLGQQVMLRARAEHSAPLSEVLLSSSSCEGPAVRVACNRRFLWRVVQLGFRDLVVRDATTPLLCRDDTRTYLFMPLEGALSPASDTVRIVSGESLSVVARAKPKPQTEQTQAKLEPERSRAIMPRSQNNGDDSRNGPAARRPDAAGPTASRAQATTATQPRPTCRHGLAARLATGSLIHLIPLILNLESSL